MRAHYLSSDRPEIQVECRDSARKLQQQSNLDEMGLKRLARYLGVRSRLVWFWWQNVSLVSNPGVTRIMLLRTRKSVSSCARDRTQVRRSGVSWVGECNVANVGPPEYSPGLGMEI